MTQTATPTRHTVLWSRAHPHGWCPMHAWAEKHTMCTGHCMEAREEFARLEQEFRRYWAYIGLDYSDNHAQLREV
jgi:hypothetical protein